MDDSATTPDLRYPIGRYKRPEEPLTPAQRAALIEQIARVPAALRAAVAGLTDAQLDTPYRPGGWSVRQVVHHIPDSHLNSFGRFKLALTESVPTIKPYDETAWAELPDAKGPVDVSLRLLESLHERWVALMRAMTEEQWSRRLMHPETGETTLDRMLALYAWHGDHHVAHITALREREGWGAAVRAVPDGYHTITPYVISNGTASLIDFLQAAFDAEVLERMDLPDGTVAHAQVRIGDSRMMMGEAQEKWPALPGGFYLYVEDCDALYRRAIDAGATSLREPTTEFYGDRSCGVQDASGNQWWISTHVEDVSPEEMKRRSDEWMAQRAKQEAA
jgi:uncharacterized glyoxalase superfamily protein PhnB/uncharacterized damage-inducible protein DinB